MKTGTYIKKMPLELQKGDAVFVMSSLLTFSHIEEREQIYDWPVATMVFTDGTKMTCSTNAPVDVLKN